MAGIGPDIAEVMTELGVTVSIFRSPTNITEKITYDINGQASNPFVREHVLATSFKYDTAIVSGDLILMEGDVFLVASKTPDSFEDEVVEFAGIILKCNIKKRALTAPEIVTWPLGTVFPLIAYQTDSIDPVTFVSTTTWVIRKDNAYGLIYAGSRGVLSNDSYTGKDTTFTLNCYVPESYGIQALDSVIVSPTEIYRVQDVERYAQPGIHIASLVDEARL